MTPQGPRGGRASLLRFLFGWVVCAWMGHACLVNESRELYESVFGEGAFQGFWMRCRRCSRWVRP